MSDCYRQGGRESGVVVKKSTVNLIASFLQVKLSTHNLVTVWGLAQLCPL